VQPAVAIVAAVRHLLAAGGSPGGPPCIYLHWYWAAPGRTQPYYHGITLRIIPALYLLVQRLRTLPFPSCRP